jgi:hypothetical protein
MKSQVNHGMKFTPVSIVKKQRSCAVIRHFCVASMMLLSIFCLHVGSLDLLRIKYTLL